MRKIILLLILLFGITNANAQTAEQQYNSMKHEINKIEKTQKRIELKLNKIQKPLKTHTLLISMVTAATMDAAMDEQRDHFSTSIFKNKNPNFWNPNVSWQTSKTIGGYHIDAWHIEKTIMVSALCVPFAQIMHYELPILKKHPGADKVLWWVISGIVWNVVFNLNYDKLMR